MGNATETVIRLALALGIALAGSACSIVAQQASNRLSRDLSAGVLGQDDLEIVAEGLPAYLLLLDGLIDGDPENAGLLLAGSRLYGAYAGGFAAEPERRIRLARKSESYARAAVCLDARALCAALDGSFDSFEAALARTGVAEIDALYGLATARAGLLQADSSNWEALADLPRIEAMLLRVRTLDPDHDDGAVSMYLGVINCIRPESLGGRPAEGRRYFEDALSRSNGNNQMARVLQAEYCARLAFDREQHDALLDAALGAEPRVRGLTLINTLAQRRARELKRSADDFF
jgi:hypothetical protein